MPLTTTKADGTTKVLYNRYRIEGNKAIFTSPDHSDSCKDEIILTSNAPKSTAQSAGTRRSSFRNIHTVDIMEHDGTTFKEYRDALVRVDTSVPVGTSQAVFDDRCAVMAHLLLDKDFTKKLMINGQIDY